MPDSRFPHLVTSISNQFLWMPSLSTSPPSSFSLVSVQAFIACALTSLKKVLSYPVSQSLLRVMAAREPVPKLKTITIPLQVIAVIFP